MHVPKDVKPLWDAVGGLSWPSKMPGFAYSVPAQLCKTGGRLAAEEGTVCSGCYALKGRYLFRNVKAAMLRRYNLMRYDPKWAEKMVKLLDHPWTRKTGGEYFRWFDSGDLIDRNNLKNIKRIAEVLPNYKFWLPTREPFAQEYRQPNWANLAVRFSLPKVYGEEISTLEMMKNVTFSENGWLGSAVLKDVKTIPQLPRVVECKARERDNRCGDCRACWDKSVQLILYHKH